MKRWAILFLIMTLCLQPVFAGSFSDVEGSDYEWAADYINAMNEKEILKGYDTGLFMPGQAVTYEQALVMAGRLFQYSADDATQASQDYQETLVTLGAANWAKLDIAVALKEGLISVEELQSLYDRDRAQAVNKGEITRILARALGLEQEANNVLIYQEVETFADFATKKSNPNWAYVEVMVKEGIINGLTDPNTGQKVFQPDSSVSRAVMATLLSRTYDRMEDKGLLHQGPQASTTTNTMTTVIQNLITGSGNQFVQLMENSQWYRVGNDAVLTKDGKAVSLSSFSKGESVVLVYEKDDAPANNIFKVTRMTAGAGSASSQSPEGTMVYEGLVIQRSDANGQVVFVQDTYENDVKAYKTWTVEKTMAISMGFETATAEAIALKQYAQVSVKDGDVVSITLWPATTTIQGTFKGIVFGTQNILKIQTDGIVRELALGKSVYVMKNGQQILVTELGLGDAVTATLAYQEVTSIMGTNTSAETIQGEVVSVTIAASTELKIRESGGQELVYTVTTSTPVYKDSKTLDIYDLRPGYQVTLYTLGDQVLNVSVQTQTGAAAFVGKLLLSDYGLKLMVVEKSDGTQMNVYYDSSTNFINAAGQATSYGQLVLSSQISVAGEYNAEGKLVANTVMILSQ